MYTFYNLLHYTALPFAATYLLWQNRNDDEFHRRWGELFGCFAAPEATSDLWIHAASVGEFNAAVPIIRGLLQLNPDLQITLTTQTATAQAQARKQFPQLNHYYVPFDVPDAIHRFLNRIQPKAAVFMECELWPNKIKICAQRRIPIIIANARLTTRSLLRYLKFPSICAQISKDLTAVLAQSQEAVQHYQQFGVNDKKIKLFGNSKMALQIDPRIVEEAKLIKQQWKPRPIWIAACTHEAEEEIILSSYQTLRKQFPNLLLIIAPRHLTRTEQVLQNLNKSGLKIHRSSHGLEAEMDILFIDQMGKLLLFYALADIAFVGGSLIDKGCHNIIEPAAMGVPVMTGPYIYQVQEQFQQLAPLGAVTIVHDKNEMAQQVKTWLEDDEKCQQISKAMQHWVQQSQSQIDHYIHYIKDFIS